MSDWPKYKSRKIVEAMPIASINADKTNLILASGEDFQTTVPGMMQQAEVGGYAIRYPDGFKSVSPMAPFVEGYIAIPPAE